MTRETTPAELWTLDSRSNAVDRVISRHQQKRLTYEALDRDSNALARGLANRGVKKGDRVAVSLGNNIEFATVGSRKLCVCEIG